MLRKKEKNIMYMIEQAKTKEIYKQAKESE